MLPEGKLPSSCISSTLAGSLPLPYFHRMDTSNLPPQIPIIAQTASPERSRSFRLWSVFAVVFLLLCVAGFVLLTGLLMKFADGGADPSAYFEIVHKPGTVDDKIAVVPLEGMIIGVSLLGESNDIVQRIKKQLEMAARDKNVKAVILRVDSPGGEVLASDEINKLLADFQRDHKKPVICSMASLAASGGYYVAAPCRYIVAHELTITGSIGVIMQGYNYRGLFDKVGVRPVVYKSGKFKDMLSGSKLPNEVLPEEEAMAQQLISESYARFKNIVETGRTAADKLNGATGRKLDKDWANFADGRILTGTQAYNLGFVDKLGDFDVAIAEAKRIAKISGDPTLIRYEQPFTFGNFFKLLGKAETAKVKIDIGMDVPSLKPGRMYFLPTMFTY